MTTATNLSTLAYITTQLRTLGTVYVPSFAYEAMTEEQQRAVQAVRKVVHGIIYCL